MGIPTVLLRRHFYPIPRRVGRADTRSADTKLQPDWPASPPHLQTPFISTAPAASRDANTGDFSPLEAGYRSLLLSQHKSRGLRTSKKIKSFGGCGRVAEDKARVRGWGWGATG